MSYLRTVAETYTSLREGGLCLSPADVDQVQDWERQGLPLEALLRLLAVGLQRYRSIYGPGKWPRSICWFKPIVSEYIYDLRRQAVMPNSADDPEGLRLRVMSEIDALRARVRAMERTIPEHVNAGLRRLFDKAASEGASWALVLRAQEEVAVARAIALPASERRALGHQLRAEAGARRPGVTPHAHRDTLRALLANWM